MLGQLELPLIKPRKITVFGKTLNVYAGRQFRIFGGPYRKKPHGLIGVKMAKEIPQFRNGDKEIDIPTEDFNVPDVTKLTIGLRAAVDDVLAGKQLYVGCMAGRGRTGLFMAVLAKAFGIENPVEYVRAHYFEHAVETQSQYKFVMHFPIPDDVQAKVKRAKRSAWISMNPRLTEGWDG